MKTELLTGWINATAIYRANKELRLEIFNDLVARYNETGRHYHNLSHIENILSDLESCYGDGIPDGLDTWPTIAGSYDYNGTTYPGVWSDQDSDGVPDALDPTPSGTYVWNGVEYLGPWVDQDGDGIPDSFDPWPTLPGSFNYEGTDYGGPWVDQDNDQIPDPADPFPAVAGSYWWQGTQ